MAVICKDCGHVNDDESIYQSDNNGKPIVVMDKYTPRFSCVNCGGQDIVAGD